MQRLKHGWKQLPDKPRRTLTFILGVLLIITSGLIGWIPGPGGMIPFLLGIAVLATEFEWAERLRDRILAWIKHLGIYMRRYPTRSVLGIVLGICVIAFCAYVFYTNII